MAVWQSARPPQCLVRAPTGCAYRAVIAGSIQQRDTTGTSLHKFDVETCGRSDRPSALGLAVRGAEQFRDRVITRRCHLRAFQRSVRVPLGSALALVGVASMQLSPSEPCALFQRVHLREPLHEWLVVWIVLRASTKTPELRGDVACYSRDHLNVEHRLFARKASGCIANQRWLPFAALQRGERRRRVAVVGIVLIEL